MYLNAISLSFFKYSGLIDLNYFVISHFEVSPN